MVVFVFNYEIVQAELRFLKHKEGKMKKSVKAKESPKCSICNVKFSQADLSLGLEGKAFVWHGQVLCKECLTQMGVMRSDAMTWEAFTKAQPQK